MEKGRVRIKDLSDVSGLCRVCLTESKKMTPLAQEVDSKLESGIVTVWHLLYRATCIDVTCDERYPSYICPMCLGLLNICYKFKRQFEESQNLLAEYFGEMFMSQSGECADINSLLQLVDTNNQTEVAPVELIAKQGKYDLKDVLIVEALDEEKPDFSGFLKNLGKEVSATFVNNSESPNGKSLKPLSKHNSVSIVNARKHKNGRSENDEENRDVLDLCDDMDEEDKKINRRISRCTVCQKVFANKKYLQRHVEQIHLHKKPSFVCEICGAYLKSRSSRYHHMTKHIGKKHKCTYCEKMYFNASNLQQHVMAVHLNERPHLCTVCGKSFSYSNALDYHMRIHTGERKYRCSYCSKTFTMQCGLNRHLRIHTGHRPYKCKFCDKAFRSKGEVDCHEMIHTGYRPYHCKYCKKGFTKTFNLKMHLAGHPGNHACEICTKTFIEPEFLKLHMKSAHGYEQENIGEASDMEC